MRPLWEILSQHYGSELTLRTSSGPRMVVTVALLRGVAQYQWTWTVFMSKITYYLMVLDILFAG